MVSAPPPEILAAIARGQTILTANQRAARSLRHAYNASRSEALWSPPAIFALDTWLASLHNGLTLNGQETRLLLNPTQQHALWRDIIAADPTVSGLRSLDSLADTAADAWRLLYLYQGAHRLRDFTVSTDTRAFQRWAETFARAAARHEYLTPAELPAALSLHLAEGNLDIANPGLSLVDFDTLVPAHAQFFENIRQAGYEVDKISTAIPSSASLVTAPDDRAGARVVLVSDGGTRWHSLQFAPRLHPICGSLRSGRRTCAPGKPCSTTPSGLRVFVRPARNCGLGASLRVVWRLSRATVTNRPALFLVRSGFGMSAQATSRH